MPRTRHFGRLAVALLLGLVLAACGKKSPLEYPLSYEQITPVTEEGRKAFDPPRDAEGRPIEPKSQRGPVPLVKSTPFDVILN